MKFTHWLLVLALLIPAASSLGAPAAPPEKASPGQTWTCPKDGSVMVYVPAGEFIMGGNRESEPQHKRTLRGFWIDKCEVTNVQFRRFAGETDYAPEGHWTVEASRTRDQFPVINITWKDACAYAKWAGKRLPTSAEWERAARGTDGRMYPWGNDWDASKAAVALKSLDSLTEVGAHPGDVSPVGCLDMAGNAMEWCFDNYSADDYQRFIKGDATMRPLGYLHVTRSFGMLGNGQDTAVCSFRGSGTPDSRLYGFRCAAGPAPDLKPSDTDYPCALNPAPKVSRTPAPPAEPKPGDVWICPKNGMEMVYVPAGEYQTGYADIELSATTTGAYWISRYPVTIGMYRQFAKQAKYNPLAAWKEYDIPGHESHPACGLAYEDAAAYAKSIGQRLPKPNEWEKAARGTDGRRFPWGNDWLPNHQVPFYVGELATIPNGCKPANRSPYGVCDMCSENEEWVDDPDLAKPTCKVGIAFYYQGKLAWGDYPDTAKYAFIDSVDTIKTLGREQCRRTMSGYFGDLKEKDKETKIAPKPVLKTAGLQPDGKTYRPINDPGNYTFRCVLDAK